MKASQVVTLLAGTEAAAAGFDITDKFTRADSATSLGGPVPDKPWLVPFGTWGVTSNHAYCVTEAGSGATVAVIDNLRADGVVQVIVTNLAAGDTAALVFRYANVANFLEVRITRELGGGADTRVSLDQVVSGTVVTLASTGFFVYADSVVLRAEMTGTAVVAKYNGATFTSQTVAVFKTKTKHGMRVVGTSARFDDFYANATLPVVLDGFPRVNSASTMGQAETGQSWTAAIGTWGIQSNKAYCAIPDGNGFGMAVIDSGLADVEIMAFINLTLGGTGSALFWDGVILRYQDVNNWIGFEVTTDDGSSLKDLVMHTCVAGTLTQTVVPATPATSVSILRVMASGANITVTCGSTILATVVNSTALTATRQGIASGGSLTRFMFWRVVAL